MLFQKCAIKIYVFFVKQANGKWNVCSESEQQYETEISTCETYSFLNVKHSILK